MATKKAAKVKLSEAEEQFIKNLPPLKEFERAFVIEDYMASEYNRLFEGAYLTLVEAFDAADVPLTSAVYETLLPEQVFKLAVHLGYDPNSKDNFIRSLSRVIGYIRQTYSDADVQWSEPTPRQRIETFLKKMRWRKTDLVKKLSGIDDYVDETWLQFIKRLCRKPKIRLKSRLQFGIDSRTLVKLKALRSIMAAYAPEQFGTLKIDDLRWTVLDSNT
jgi:hypothetical protein